MASRLLALSFSDLKVAWKKEGGREEGREGGREGETYRLGVLFLLVAPSNLGPRHRSVWCE